MPSREDLNPFPLSKGVFSREPFVLNTPEVQGEMEARRDIENARLRSQAKAARILAERECPEDIKEWGRAHGIANFAEATWINGFLIGLRFAEIEKETPDAFGS